MLGCNFERLKKAILRRLPNVLKVNNRSVSKQFCHKGNTIIKKTFNLIPEAQLGLQNGIKARRIVYADGGCSAGQCNGHCAGKLVHRIKGKGK